MPENFASLDWLMYPTQLSTQAFGQDLRPTANSGGPLRERFAGRALP